VLAIFKKLQARYLHKWTSAIEGIEEEAMREWGRVLKGLTGEQIKCGLDNWSSDWPPAADEFRKACTGGNGFGLDYVPQYYHKAKDSNGDEVKKITSQASDETRKAALEACRGILPR